MSYRPLSVQYKYGERQVDRNCSSLWGRRGGGRTKEVLESTLFLHRATTSFALVCTKRVSLPAARGFSARLPAFSAFERRYCIARTIFKRPRSFGTYCACSTTQRALITSSSNAYRPFLRIVWCRIPSGHHQLGNKADQGRQKRRVLQARTTLGRGGAVSPPPPSIVSREDWTKIRTMEFPAPLQLFRTNTRGWNNGTSSFPTCRISYEWCAT